MGCPGEHTVVAYLQGALEPAPRQVVERHVDRCSHCRRLLAAMVESTFAGRSVVPGSVPAHRQPTSSEQIGRYRVEGLLGRGSMGTVVIAYDPALDRRIALKLIELGAEMDRARVRDEARALAALRDPNVVTVYDVGESGGRMFLAMEWVRGTTLRRWLAARPRSRRTILQVFDAAGRGLLAAHAAGIVHRDFKPDNVFIDTHNRVQVGDFGLAIQDDRSTLSTDQHDEASRTRNSSPLLVGTPAYMAPEQLCGLRVDARADQFAFCVALWEALTGARPFAAARLAGLREAIARGPDPRVLLGVPSSLRVALLRGLAEDPEARHPDLAHLLAAMQPQRSRVGPGLAAVAAVALVAFGVARPTHGAACQDPGLAEAWSPLVRSRLLDELVQPSDMRPGVDLAEHAVASVDAYVERWSSVYDTVCEAAGPEAATLRCLDTLRQRVIEALPESDASPPLALVLDWTIHGLPDPRRCRELGHAPPPGPQSPAVAAALKTLAESRHRVMQGDLSAAMNYADAASQQATGIHDLAFRARMSVERGMILARLGRQEEAREGLLNAYWTAREVANDEVARLAAHELVTLYGHDRAALLQWAGHAEAATQRTGGSLAELHVHVGIALTEANDPDAALERFDQTLALLREEGREHSQTAAIAHINAATTLSWKKSWIEAARRGQMAVDLLSELEDDGLNISIARLNVGLSLANGGRYAEAFEPLTIALEALEARFPPDHPDLATALNATGFAALELGYLARAIDLLERARAIKEGLPDGSDFMLLNTLNTLARAYGRAGDPAMAWSLFQRTFTVSSGSHGPEHPTVAWSRLGLGRLLLEFGEPDRALTHYERALDITRRSEGESDPSTMTVRTEYAWALLRTDARAAADQLDGIVALMHEVLGPDHPTFGDMLRALAEVEHASGDDVAAAQHRTDAIAILEARLPATHPLVRRARAPLGTAAHVRIAAPSATKP
jgi:eukaryotic-like serine/threonine-protein kinase